MADTKSSFWTPRTVAAGDRGRLLVVALATWWACAEPVPAGRPPWAEVCRRRRLWVLDGLRILSSRSTSITCCVVMQHRTARSSGWRRRDLVARRASRGRF